MKVLLSYSSLADREVAGEIAERLREAGFTVWDPTTSVYPGENWALAHGRALDDADVMVVLLSPDSARSPWTAWEIGFAMGQKRFAGRVLSVVVRESRDVPWMLERFLTIRAVGRDREHGIRQLVAGLREIERRGARTKRNKRSKRVAAREAL